MRLYDFEAIKIIGKCLSLIILLRNGKEIDRWIDYDS